MNNQEQQEFTCICGKSFKSRRSLGTHKQHCETYLKSIGKALDKYICSGCEREFKSSAALQAHLTHCDKYVKLPSKTLHSSKYWNDGKQRYVCECEKEFEKHSSLNAHFCYCLIHKAAIGVEVKIADSKRRSGDKCNLSKAFLGEEAFNDLHKKLGRSLQKSIQTGKTKATWKGRYHSEASKEKMRKSTANYIMTIVGSRPRYNKSSIPILEQIAKEHGWNIQHAENGGEFYTGIGYFVDAYDKEKNIVLEYDESKHYSDVENNVLRQKDLDRQRRIIEHLHCEYWRYNEKMKVLWKVE